MKNKVMLLGAVAVAVWYFFLRGKKCSCKSAMAVAPAETSATDSTLVENVEEGITPSFAGGATFSRG